MCIYNDLLDLVGLLLTIWFDYINMNVVLETVMYAILSTVNTCELIIPLSDLRFCYYIYLVSISDLLPYLSCYYICFVTIFVLLSYRFCW